ncbi:MAG TPA: MdtA/MuxA family multidrug efflux RND transporter periplasmic adaptor subunit [Burkholderiales bacterium]|jgi:multidrug efflux system membrane fusion protein|nr:MdtA/MuxA family multidrug efflux RND transporter periplasmic adaptor subunit [Burkholderiales bacterium]
METEARPERRGAGGWLRRNWVWILGICVVAGGAYLFYRYPPVAPPAAGKKKGDAASRVTPVVADQVRTGEIRIYLNGLGTVTPMRTVTVRSRVDGELQRVHFTEGQLVKSGEVLAEIDPRPFQVQLAQAEGTMARDRALLENARIDLERYRTLLKQDSIAEQQVASQESLVRQYEGTVKVDQSQIDNARLQLTYARVTAPVGGRIGLRQVDPGNIVRAGDTNGLAVITQVQPITVIFTIPQDNLPAVLKRIQTGERVPVEAFDRDQKTRLANGVLLTVDNQIDTTTGTVKLKAQFANDDGKLFPNQFVNIRMLLDTLQDVTTVSTAAIQRGTQGIFVYVVGADYTVSLRPVKLGTTEGNRAAVESGLKPGELVVVDGTDRLREGAKVELSNREAGKPAPYDSSKRGKGGRKKKGGDEGADKGSGDKAAESGADKKGANARADKKGGEKGTERSAEKKGGEKGTGEGGGDRKRWRDMNDEEKAAAKAKRESMTDEEKAAAKARREKKGIE